MIDVKKIARELKEPEDSEENFKLVSLRMDKELYKTIKEISDESDLSVTKVIQKLLEKALKG